MIFVEKLANLGLKTDWCTLLLAWTDSTQTLISDSELIEFAENLLSKTTDAESDAELPEVLDIAIASPGEKTAIHKALRRLSLLEKEGSKDTTEVSKRKLRLVLLVDLLQTLDEKDYVNGLMKLTDFWIDMDFPSDMPIQIQGRGNDISPQKYYTLENFNNSIETHRAWIVNEKNRLKDLEVAQSLELSK